MATALYFDTASIGRPRPEVIRLADAYNRLSQTHAHVLDHFHHYGYKSTAELSRFDKCYESLAVWNGFGEFEKSLLALLGVRSDRECLLDYGKTTRALWDWVRLLIQRENLRVVWSSDLYYPWRLSLAQDTAQRGIRGIRIDTERLITDGCSTGEFVKALGDVVERSEPDIVVLSHVTQGGVLIPVEQVIRGAIARGGQNALYVVDGCQAFGRVDADLSRAKGQVAYIGCMHKAMRAKIGMGFLVCTYGDWQRKLRSLIRRDENSGSDRGVRIYARTRGADAHLPAVQCEGVVTAAAAIHGLTSTGVRESHRSNAALQAHFARAIRSGGGKRWSILTPKRRGWHSGILTFESTKGETGEAIVCGLKRKGIHASTLGPGVRIAFDATHTQQDVDALVASLCATHHFDN